MRRGDKTRRATALRVGDIAAERRATTSGDARHGIGIKQNERGDSASSRGGKR